MKNILKRKYNMNNESLITDCIVCGQKTAYYINGNKHNNCLLSLYLCKDCGGATVHKGNEKLKAEKTDKGFRIIEQTPTSSIDDIGIL